MAEDPVIPKLEDLKRAFIESNRVEAERNEKNEKVERYYYECTKETRER